MTDAVRIITTLKGPAFNGQLERDVSKAVDESKQAVGEFGATVVQRNLSTSIRVGTSYTQGVRAHRLKGGMVKIINLDYPKVLQGPWLEGVDSRNSPSRFKGYSAYRKSVQVIQARVPQLTKKMLARFL